MGRFAHRQVVDDWLQDLVHSTGRIRRRGQIFRFLEIITEIGQALDQGINLTVVEISHRLSQMSDGRNLGRLFLGDEDRVN